MVGNSVRSDVLPVLEAGGAAVHVPYPLTWAHEQVPADGAAFATLAGLADLSRWLGG
jgi:putative hydrolase of the HAD superfamily